MYVGSSLTTRMKKVILTTVEFYVYDRNTKGLNNKLHELELTKLSFFVKCTQRSNVSMKRINI